MYDASIDSLVWQQHTPHLIIFTKPYYKPNCQFDRMYTQAYLLVAMHLGHQNQLTHASNTHFALLYHKLGSNSKPTL